MQVKAKKHLGQNFLKDEAVLERIVASADISSDDTVVEIGSGTGLLTRVLAEKAKKVVSLEVDSDLIPGLLKQFPLASNVSIVHQDILKADLMEIVKKYIFNDNSAQDDSGRARLGAVLGAIEEQSKPYSKGMVSSTGDWNDEMCQISTSLHYKVVANIPYYITAPIIQYLLELPVPPETIVLMIQKEVAERITAKVGDMSILAVSVQYYADPELLFVVPKTAFDPMPQVDSAVVRLVPKQNFDKDGDKRFFRVVKAGFSARRKTLVNNIAAGFHLSKEDVAQKLAQIGLDANIRAQALSIDDWKQLSKVM